jgi:F-type H+-transporting ATPase subunit b
MYMNWLIAKVTLLAQEHVPETNDPKDLYPHLSELIVGALAFGILFFFMWKWVMPRLNQALEARRDKIQGDLEKAEQTRTEAERMLSDYRDQLSGAREEGNRIIEEARRTAESIRQEAEQRAEREAQAIVSRAQEEIRAERDRVFQELRTQVGALSVELAARVVGGSLDRERQVRLVEEYIDEVAAMPGGNGQSRTGGDSSGSAESPPEEGRS